MKCTLAFYIWRMGGTMFGVNFGFLSWGRALCDINFGVLDVREDKLKSNIAFCIRRVGGTMFCVSFGLLKIEARPC